MTSSHWCRLTLTQRNLQNEERLLKTRLWLLAGWREFSPSSGESLRVLCTTISFFTIHYREESEKVSELKSVSGSGKLPYGTLASGTEGIKEAIQGFDDAYVRPILLSI